MNNLIFLKKFDLVNTTIDEQDDFIISEIVNELECGDFGKLYTNDVLSKRNLNTFILEEVAKYYPLWVIAEGNSASVAQHLRNQRKILINPTVKSENLNNISEFDRTYTYGFFDRTHEKDYENFQSVYPRSAWYGNTNDLYLFTIKDIIKDIIEKE